MGRSTEKETGLSEQRKYRSWTAQQKIEMVLAGLRGDRTVKDVCREHEISDTLFYSWRDKLLEGGREALAGKEERSGERELRRKICELERALGRKTYELEIAGSIARLGVSVRVARSRELVARGFAVAAVARVLQISRQALYRVPTPRTVPQRRPAVDPVEAAIVEEALANQTDGYRMVTAFVSRKLGRPVNRNWVLRVMRERKLIQRRRPLERRKRPGFFRVERPRQLWQLDMTSVWVAEHGWC
jgi:transposase-like protein